MDLHGLMLAANDVATVGDSYVARRPGGLPSCPDLLACLLLTAAAHKSPGPDMCWLILLSGGGESQSSSALSQGKLHICSPVTM